MKRARTGDRDDRDDGADPGRPGRVDVMENQQDAA